RRGGHHGIDDARAQPGDQRRQGAQQQGQQPQPHGERTAGLPDQLDGLAAIGEHGEELARQAMQRELFGGRGHGREASHAGGCASARSGCLPTGPCACARAEIQPASRVSPTQFNGKVPVKLILSRPVFSRLTATPGPPPRHPCSVLSGTSPSSPTLTTARPHWWTACSSSPAPSPPTRKWASASWIPTRSRKSAASPSRPRTAPSITVVCASTWSTHPATPISAARWSACC